MNNLKERIGKKNEVLKLINFSQQITGEIITKTFFGTDSYYSFEKNKRIDESSLDIY